MNQLQAELYHYGIKGQKYGVRRFQNEDGSLTEAGRRRYSSAKIGQTGSSEPKHSSGSSSNSSAETGIKASSTSRGGKSSSNGKGKSSSKSSESGIKASSSGGGGKSSSKSGEKNTKFDVGPIREPISVTMKKEKEKNRRVVEAYIGGDSHASTTSYSSVSSSPAVYKGKKKVSALIGGG